MLFCIGTSVLVDLWIRRNRARISAGGVYRFNCKQAAESAPDASMDTQTGCPETFYMYRKSIAVGRT